MKRVWSLSAGSYSGYGILALFDAEELAEQARLEHPDRDEEYDAPFVESFWQFDRAPVASLRISSWFRDGEETNPGRHSRALREEPIGEWELRRSGRCHAYLDSTVHPIDREKRGPAWELCVEGTDAERVRKVFSEKRAQLKAMPWVTMDDADVQRAIAGADL